jgi:hypothetical protein
MAERNYDKLNAGNKLEDVIIFRVFAIIAVVIFHSYWIYISATGSDMYIARTPYEQFYKQILLNWLSIPNFFMALFVFVSGYLFTHLYCNKGKYKDLFPFIKNKAKRLLLPYSIFSILMGITLWGTTRELTLESFLGGNTHLWFILMLFSCFVVGRVWIFLYEKFPNKYFLVLSFIVSALISYHPTGGRILWVFGIIRAEKFFFYFLLGMLVLMYKESLMKYLNRKTVLIALFVIYIGSCLYVGKYCELAYTT